MITGGPYRFVRHPAYGGAILFEAAVSVLLASWWSLAAGGAGIALLLARAVRFRLLPGVW